MDDVAFERVAPAFRVRDLSAALIRYARLGFITDVDEPAQYGFAHRGEVHLHLFPDHPDEPDGTGGIVYLYVSDADTLHAQWTSAGVDGQFLGPHDTPYRLREFIYTDPDGIVHRVGPAHLGGRSMPPATPGSRTDGGKHRRCAGGRARVRGNDRVHPSSVSRVGSWATQHPPQHAH